MWVSSSVSTLPQLEDGLFAAEVEKLSLVESQAGLLGSHTLAQTFTNPAVMCEVRWLQPTQN